MAIQHKDIPDEERHEPKGASTALQDSVYVANGAGSGGWREIDSPMFSGLSGDGGSSNKKFLSNGANGFRLVSDAVYVQMGITSNAAPFTVNVAASASLDVNSEYAQLTGPWEGGLGSEAGFNTNRVTVSIGGVYRVSMVATVSSFATASAKVGFKIKTSNGNTLFARRKATLQATSTTSVEQGAIEELINLSAGDDVTVFVASTATGAITVQDLSLIVQLIKAA